MIRLCVCLLCVSVCRSLSLSGWIQSPGYPQGYNANVNVTWRRCAPPGYTLTLSLLHLDLEDSHECENDALKVSIDLYFVLSSSGVQMFSRFVRHQVFADRENIVSLCGQMTEEKLHSDINPLLRSSSGGCLFLSFQSDYSNTERHTGFRLFYTTQDVDECWMNDAECSHFCQNYIGGYSCSCKPGFFLNEDQHTCHANCTEEHYGEGELRSPGSPGPYAENADCSFRLSVDEGSQIELQFVGVFDVKGSDGQCIDYVMIKTDLKTWGPFCGADAPVDIATSSRHAEVIFHSNPIKGDHQGFTLIYKPRLMECPGRVIDNAEVVPLQNMYTVGTTVTVTCVRGYTLHNSDLKMFQSRCQVNGEWRPQHTCEPVDCGIPDCPEMMMLTEKYPQSTYRNNISFKCSSKFYQLLGEADFICSADGDWISKNGETFSQNVPQCVPVCGLNKNIYHSFQRIFGGEKASLGKIPWQLLFKGPGRGGASLINDRWALTAAHVVENKKEMIFYGGMVDAQDRNMVEMVTEKIIIHPDYKNVNKKNFDNDIALVKMKTRVPLSDNLSPVCLPESKTNGPVMEDKQGTVSGFGATDEFKMISRVLNYGHVEEYLESPCFETNLPVTDNMFCAGEVDAHVDSCKGDSGGPLVIPMLGTGSRAHPYRLKGIVSWGPPVCGDKNYKGYYTKVENYLDWIRVTMETNDG